MNKPVIAYFAGNDGSGKSTLSKALLSRFQEAGYKAERVWWIEGDNSLLRKLLRKIRAEAEDQRSPAHSLRTRPADWRCSAMAILYPYLALIDYLKFGFVMMHMHMSAATEIIILDRYFYDVIHAISKEFDFPARKTTLAIRIMGCYLPRPDITFMVMVPPEVSLARKPDEIRDIHNALRIWQNHNELEAMLRRTLCGGVLRLDNTGRPEEAMAIAEARILELMER